MLKFYIGSGLERWEDVRALARALERHGWKQTYDWTAGLFREKGPAELAEIARLERQGVADADLVVILLPAGRGSHIELGMALALGKPVALCAEEERTFLGERAVSFYELPQVDKLTGNPEAIAEKLVCRYGNLSRNPGLPS